MHSARPLLAVLLPGLTGLVLALADAPWGLAAVAFGCLVLAFVVIVIQSVFPQESAHRLAWWRDRRRRPPRGRGQGAS
ncbi:hypothetical protein EOT10_36905 [Streptomyces antnestii]|uniref:Uncharacterized protein n=1 Tax=Streptomyces antnestii TaxID=2494256 RepID=A0A437P1Y1_9ACTN|nr:hypothetical protein [Streptomyces sp. San01]RVU16255.1 hypothetical protein EOT10_36905 [Streptomyces sp. San01]